VLAVFALYVFYTTRRDAPPRLWSWTAPAFGSTYTVRIAARRIDERTLAALQTDADALIDALNRRMSTWLTNSDVSLFNASFSTEPFPVSADLAEVTRVALELSRLSGGAFDGTFSPMFQLWGFGKDGPKSIPDKSLVESTRARCGHRHLRVLESNRLRKDVPDLRFDVNAVAPGYAADRLAAMLLGRGFSNIYVDVGGEVIVHGASARGDRWRVGIETPRYDEPLGADIFKVAHLPSGWALATSGDYRSYVRDTAGRVYSHIFDPRLGKPVTSRLASVSVLATNCMLADGLATTLFVMGPEEGIPWLTKIPAAEAFFILRDETGGFHSATSPGFDTVAGP
jgi:thiamine biosynthesis lipoprotein